MAKTDKTFELIYSTQHTDYIQGRAYSNPRFFTSPRTGVTKVLLVGDWPQIAAAYAALGVPVERMDADAATGHPVDPAMAEAAAKLVPQVTDEERAATHIPENWRKLPWTGKADAGLTLRGLAAILCDVPVLNKAQAVDAVEAELHRRAAHLNASAGLTRAEINADLEAMGVEVDPTMSDDDALALRNEARARRDG